MTETEIDEADIDDLDEVELLLLAYHDEMIRLGVRPSQMIEFAAHVITAAAAGQYDTQH